MESLSYPLSESPSSKKNNQYNHGNNLSSCLTHTGNIVFIFCSLPDAWTVSPSLDIISFAVKHARWNIYLKTFLKGGDTLTVCITALCFFIFTHVCFKCVISYRTSSDRVPASVVTCRAVPAYPLLP